MKNLKDIILEKLIINKNIKINNKTIDKKIYKPSNTIESVDKYINMLPVTFGVNARNKLKDFLKEYINGKVLVYVIEKPWFGDGYQLNLDIKDNLSKEIDSIDIQLGGTAKNKKVTYKVYVYGDQYVIYVYNNQINRILLDDK